jgi:hypothetical protein
VRRIHPSAIASIGVLVAAAACRTFGADSAEDPPPPGPPRDASASDEAAPLVPSPSDAGDAGDAGEAMADGCVRLVNEEMTTAIPAWEQTLDGTGKIGWRADAGAAAPGALAASVTSSGSVSEAQLNFTTPATATSVSATFAIQIQDPTPTAGGVEVGCVLELFSGDSDNFVDAELQLIDGKLGFRVFGRKGGVGTTQGDRIDAGATPASWVKTTIAFEDITATNALLRIDLDGARLVANRAVALPKPPTDIKLKCGIDSAAATANVVVLVDDVALDVCK